MDIARAFKVRNKSDDPLIPKSEPKVDDWFIVGYGEINKTISLAVRKYTNTVKTYNDITQSDNSTNLMVICVTYFPNNCGLAILHGANFYHVFSEEQRQNCLKAILSVVKDMKVGGAIYTTSSSQPRLSELLNAVGFTQQQTSFVNPNTDRSIQTWIYDFKVKED